MMSYLVDKLVESGFLVTRDLVLRTWMLWVILIGTESLNFRNATPKKINQE